MCTDFLQTFRTDVLYPDDSNEGYKPYAHTKITHLKFGPNWKSGISHLIFE